MLTGDPLATRSRPCPKRREPTRWGTILFAIAVLAIPKLAAGGRAPASDEPLLKAGEAHAEAEFSGERSFRLPLSGDSLVVLFAEQRGTDVAIEVSDPRGRPVVRVDRNPSPWSEELVALVSDGGGLFRVRLRSVGPSAGGYRLTLLEGRPSDPTDARRVEAEEQFAIAIARDAEDNETANRLAAGLLEKAAAAFASLGAPQRQAAALHNLGTILRDLSEYERALAAFREALRLRQERSAPWLLASSHGQIGRTLQHLGEAEEGLAELETAREIVELYLTEHPGEKRAQETAGTVFNDLGAHHYHSGNIALARDHYARARTAYAAADDLKGVATVQMNLGVVYGYLGDNEAAIEAYTEADEIRQRIRYGGLQAVLLLNLGSRLRAAGRLEEALDKLHRSLEGYRERGDVDGTQAAIAHLGAAYAQLGDNDRSRTFHERALAIASEKRWPQQAAMAHINLGWLAIVDGDYASALTSFQAAGALVNDEESWHFHRAWAALGLGTSLVELNDAEAALPHLETALGESRLAQSVTSETEAQRKLGRAYLAIGDLPASEAALSEALRLVGSDLPRRGATLSQWARLAERRGDLTAARRYVEEAIEIRESLRARVTSDELRASFLARWRDDYALLIDLLVRLDAERPGEGLSAEALAVSERARSRVLHELLTEARLGARGYLSPEQADRQKEIETRLSSIQHELFRRTGGDEAQLREQLANTQDDWTRLEREIRATAPRYADLHYPQPLTLGEIQTALDEGSALVEFALGEPRSYLFVVTRMNLKVHELAAAADIAAVVEAAREAMQKPLPFLWPQQAAVLHELYRLVLAPAEPDLEGVDSLLIAPDLVLYYLPFEALLTRPPSGGIATSLAGDSVLARWSVSYVPSATVFDGLPEATTIDDGGHELLAFADPTGDGGVASGSVGWSSESRWPPLPGAVAEVRAIAELFDPETVEIYHGAAASEKAVKSLPGLAVARRLHFASHGVLDEKRPAYSGLVLAAEADGSEDGLLQVREIFELSLAAEVAVLSACESGLGKHVQGEGLVGLSRAFFYAGVPTVVVSLWQVTDASTPDLMADFYRQLTAGRSPSVALRSAKLSMIRKGKWSHPNFWAPFIVLGRP